MSQVRIVLAAVVTAVWVVGYVKSYFFGGSAPQELSGLMAIVLGWATAGEIKDAIKRRLSNGDGEDASKD